MKTLIAPFIPESAPFSGPQRAWLNGYLAGLYSRAPADPSIAEGDRASAAALPVTILYGSQTGTAEGIAREAAEALASPSARIQVADMADYDAAALPDERCMLIITSTYGDGEMPDNAAAFWEALASDSAPALAGLRFSVLALGDSSYETYCSAGKAFDARLEELGATRIADRIDCDVDFEEPFAAWLKSVLQVLAGSAVRPSAPPAAAAEPKGWSRARPFAAPLATNLVLNQPGSTKETRHYELSLAGSGIEYEPGDILEIMPANRQELVDELLRFLRCDGEEGVTGAAGETIALRKALTEDVDLAAPSPALLSAIAERCPDADLPALLREDRRAELASYLWGRDVLDVLREHEKSAPAPAELVGMLRKLRPREYSIASSLKAYPDQVHLTVATVRYRGCGRDKYGVCSTQLAERVAPGDTVPVWVKRNRTFGVPQEDTVPMIMVGPGTGIAPFRAFLQERRARGATGRNWLFFGDRQARTDFLYRQELEGFQADGYLHELSLAFSRDQDAKIYVQHRMREQGRALFAWLEEGAYFFVCGDATHMAKDVDAALHDVIRRYGGGSEDRAREYVHELKRAKRYVRDVY